MDNLEARIRTGISFFRTVAGKNYDAEQVKKYLPAFLNLVEKKLNGQEDIYEQAKEIFK